MDKSGGRLEAADDWKIQARLHFRNLHPGPIPAAIAERVQCGAKDYEIVIGAEFFGQVQRLDIDQRHNRRR